MQVRTKDVATIGLGLALVLVLWHQFIYAPMSSQASKAKTAEQNADTQRRTLDAQLRKLTDGDASTQASKKAIGRRTAIGDPRRREYQQLLALDGRHSSRGRYRCAVPDDHTESADNHWWCRDDQLRDRGHGFIPADARLHEPAERVVAAGPGRQHRIDGGCGRRPRRVRAPRAHRRARSSWARFAAEHQCADHRPAVRAAGRGRRGNGRRMAPRARPGPPRSRAPCRTRNDRLGQPRRANRPARNGQGRSGSVP